MHVTETKSKSEMGAGDPSEACRLSTRRPKPGFSGHLWQIARAISTRFPSLDSLPPPSNQLNGKLPPPISFGGACICRHFMPEVS
ncbi:unnamed protein product [Dibothriocephalus latus]|uniref:Uncharacterized protein n=1 Tax=Dibothriocephalus latus TaxID=60516 RepID=A0A3P7MTQ3_DIBLA|nr:unnamed protein product [Dibothriocephalus latus]